MVRTLKCGQHEPKWLDRDNDDGDDNDNDNGNDNNNDNENDEILFYVLQLWIWTNYFDVLHGHEPQPKIKMVRTPNKKQGEHTPSQVAASVSPTAGVIGRHCKIDM